MSFYLNGLKKFFVFHLERSRGEVAGMVFVGAGAGCCSVKNIEEMAFRPLVAKRERVRLIAAARLNSGVIGAGGVATCDVKKRLGVGCRKRERLRVRALVDPVRRAFW